MTIAVIWYSDDGDTYSRSAVGGFKVVTKAVVVPAVLMAVRAAVVVINLG